MERIKLRGHILEDAFTRSVSNLFAELYRRKRAFRKPILKLQRWLGRALKVKTEILTIEPIGEISITYNIYSERVHVQCDLRGLDRGVDRRVFILNEQGSSLFRRYDDSDGLSLVDKSIGAWERVRRGKHAYQI